MVLRCAEAAAPSKTPPHLPLHTGKAHCPGCSVELLQALHRLNKAQQQQSRTPTSLGASLRQFNGFPGHPGEMETPLHDRLENDIAMTIVEN